jgi:beta-mannosidase
MLAHWLDWHGVHSLEALVELTQDYQVAINRFYIDRLRYYKYRPTGGIVPFMFHDPNPAVAWSILDYWRVPKRSYHAMRLAFSPQYVFSLLSQDRYPVGKAIDLPIYIVNDAHQPVPVDLTARLIGPGGVELAKVERSLTLPADCMAMEIERLRLTPDRAGDYRLDLKLCDGEGGGIEQEYAVIVEEGERMRKNHKT